MRYFGSVVWGPRTQVALDRKSVKFPNRNVDPTSTSHCVRRPQRDDPSQPQRKHLSFIQSSDEPVVLEGRRSGAGSCQTQLDRQRCRFFHFMRFITRETQPRAAELHR